MKSDEIIFLLGAGASKEAGLPISATMMDKVEELIEANDKWKSYKDLYNCLKSSIMHSFGMKGEYGNNLVNIETLVNTMEELNRSLDHPIYPFVGSWIPRLTELTNNDFTLINDFRKKIITELLERWMKYEQDENIEYYKGFLRFQTQCKSVIRIFSLNYDRCIEEACKDGKINRGIDPSSHEWNWRNFENEEKNDFNIILYKLHGSIDWSRERSGIVKERKDGINEGEAALIFGTTYKLQYLDPFLYLIYEFRRRTLDPRTSTIICIGYSFGDEHINGIISQSIADNSQRRIIVVSPTNEDKIEEKKKQIAKKLEIPSEENIGIIPIGAKDFLQDKLCVEYIEKYMPVDEQPF